MKKISLIGATGSIGRQVTDVVLRHSDRYKIVAVCANSPTAELDEVVKRTGAEFCATAKNDGEAAYEAATYPEADIIFNAAGGFAGIEYSIRALCAGKTLALANKETLVCGGSFVTALAKAHGAEIIPVDSEHSAIWQCLNFKRSAEDISRLIITASGGAFRGRAWETLKSVTPREALNHPTWSMGKKITVDSATLANKGYEVIEAHELFGVPYGKIEAVIHPQSVVHSLVEFADGACIAQMGTPTMEVPIQLALSYPQRLETTAAPLGFNAGFSLDFERLNEGKYPLFDLAVSCGKEGGSAPCAFNAADEEAVKAFLDGRIAFTDIYSVADGVLQAVERVAVDGAEALKYADAKAREVARAIIDRLQ